MSKRKSRDSESGALPSVGSIRPLREGGEHNGHARVFGYEQRRDTWKAIALPRVEKKTIAPKAKKWNRDTHAVSDRRVTDQLNQLTKTLPANVFYSIMPLYCLSKQFGQAVRVEFVWPKTPRQPLIVRVWKGHKDDMTKQVVSHEMVMCPLTLNQ